MKGLALVYGYKIPRTKYLEYKDYSIDQIPSEYINKEYLKAIKDDNSWNKYKEHILSDKTPYDRCPRRCSEKEYLQNCLDNWVDNNIYDMENEGSFIIMSSLVDVDNIYIGVDITNISFSRSESRSKGAKIIKPFVIPTPDSLDSLNHNLYNVLSDESKKNGPVLWAIQTC